MKPLKALCLIGAGVNFASAGFTTALHLSPKLAVLSVALGAFNAFLGWTR
jgi:hypothetical protein